MEVTRLETLRMAGISLRALARAAGCSAPSARDAVLGYRTWSPRFAAAWRGLEVERLAAERAESYLLRRRRAASPRPAGVASNAKTARLLTVLAEAVQSPRVRS